MIDESLLNDFIPEALDQLEILESNIILLETQKKDEEVISNIFRAAHTIKGSSEYIGLKKIATVAHKLENLLDMVRHGDIQPNNELISLLIELHDCMAKLANELLERKQEKTDITAIVAKTDRFCDKAKSGGDEAFNAALDVMDEGEEKPSALAEEADDGDGFLDFMDEDARPQEEATDAGVKEDAEMGEDELNDFEQSLSQELNDVSVTEQGGDGGRQSEAAEDQKALARLKTASGYDEEYDEELFKIFLDHLQENLNNLINTLSKGETVKAEETLRQCAAAVTSLRSSAAYMDYGDLVIFYDAWSSQLDAVLNRAVNGESVSFAFIADYMDQIIQHFSLADKISPLKADAPVKTEPSVQEPAPAPERQTVSEPSVTKDDMGDEFPVDTLEAFGDADISHEPAEMVEAGQPVQTKGLFDELDAVFDTAPQSSKTGIAGIDPFEEDIEDELSALPSSGHRILKAEAKMTEKPPAAKSPAKPAKKPEDEEKLASDREKAAREAPAKTDKKKAEVTDMPASISSAPPPSPEPKALVQEEASGKIIYDDHTGAKIAKQTLRVAADKIDKLMNQVGELVVNRASYAQLYNEMREFQRSIRNLGLDVKESKWIRDFTFRLSEATVALGRVANDLQEGVMKIRMLPIAQLFNRYPRLVRDLIHNTNKQVQLEIQGEETELDKMVIEEIADPLVHIIRNAVDHGIETVEERKRKNKPPVATVRLESYHESNHVVIEIIDDGRGINPQLIRNTAIEKGLFTRDELDRMRSKELLSIIMIPGFSTSETITTTSGRGVGMDVVKKNVEKLNGTIEIDSDVDEGTRIRIKIPLTLAIIQALLVRVGGEVFTIPLSVVEETLRVAKNEINTIEGIEVIQLRDRVLSLLRLTNEFKKVSKSLEPEHEYVVVVNTGMRQVGLVVDSLIGQEEAVIKPLVDFLQERSGFSGATILGDGSVSLILDVYELVNICMERQASLKHTTEGYMGFSTAKSLKPEKGLHQGAMVH